MKLLFDENLSAELCSRLADLFPGSTQVRLVGLTRASDAAIRDYAKVNGFVVVSLDADFADMSALLGAPPKIIWLRCGNQPTGVIERLLRQHAHIIALFEQDDANCLEIYPEAS